MRLLTILDPPSKLDLDGDSTYALLLEAARRGYELWTCQQDHLNLEHDDAIADAQPTVVGRGSQPFSFEPRARVPLEAFDAVLMRKDPPVDVDYLQATWLLERARGKTLLVNDPRGLRELNEHLCILRFPDLVPPTIVTRDQKRLREFLDEQGGKIVVKPIDGYGGYGVFVVKAGDPNTSSLLETATQAGRAWTMAQRYIPEATVGDKRILLVDGESIGAVLRVPAAGEARDNLHVGGTAVRCEIDEDDQRIIAAIAPTIREFGLLFVGLDVIGGRLTEMNFTSPTGIRHLERLEGGNPAGKVLDAIVRAAEL